MATIKDAFNRAFAQAQRVRTRPIVAESDSDSAEEASKKELQKTKERLDRGKGGNKSNRHKRGSEQYRVRHKIRRVTVNSKTNPEILSLNQNMVGTPSESKEMLVAESYFVNQRNTDLLKGGSNAHLSPHHHPFVRALLLKPREQMFDIQTCKLVDQVFPTLEVVHRQYEEGYLREPLDGERACVFGSKCEGLQIRTNTAGHGGFILREFLLPSEQKEYERTGKYPAEVRMCLMCKRKEIARAFVNVRADWLSMRTDSILQDYRNVVEVEGEYCLKDCILTRRHAYEGVVLPIVMHIQTAYEMKTINGVRHYVQWRMGYPDTNEHFLFSAPSH